MLIKLSIVLAAFYFIYTKLVGNDDLEFNTFLSFLKENSTFSLKTIIFLVFLSAFNWFFEILKWYYLVASLKPISFKLALEQTLGALTASLITPNRIGDYGVKAMYYKKPLRTKIVGLNLISNSTQMLVTTVLGGIGGMFFINQYGVTINHMLLLKLSVTVLIIGLLVLFVLKQKRFKIKGFSLASILNFITSIPLKTHALTLVLSVIRYLIFSFQFYYLLTLFGVDINYTNAMAIITSLYFLASIVPTISFFDVVIKGSIAVFLFGYIHVNTICILSVTTLMWLFNFVLPSSVGSYFVLNFKFPKPEKQC